MDTPPASLINLDSENMNIVKLVKILEKNLKLHRKLYFSEEGYYNILKKGGKLATSNVKSSKIHVDRPNR